MTQHPLLSARNLQVSYARDGSWRRVVNGASFDIHAGETVALVGESGCGKTAIALAIMRLLARNGRIDPGSEITFDGQAMLSLDEPAMCDLRGRRIAMIFQEPASALNPVMTVGDQVAEVARLHGDTPRREAWSRAVRMLERTGIARAADRARQYPHELSGGTRQRVLIAMALLLSPALVIADEPTSALDVTVQAQILDLMREFQAETQMAMLLITHDFGVVAELCSRAMVMQAGTIVEDAPVDQMFRAPAHAYTAELLRAVPRLSAHA
jgi:ABC-type dipeptide/oligopeptide/nickel transport system ATPase component